MTFQAIPLEEKMRTKTLPLSCGCHYWTGCKDKDGYGFVRHQGKNLKAHRVAFELATGQQPIYVCHTCDQPSCVNPEHLFAGDNSANQLDAVTKGRHAGQQKVTPEQIALVKLLAVYGGKPGKMAQAAGLNIKTVNKILAGEGGYDRAHN